MYFYLTFVGVSIGMNVYLGLVALRFDLDNLIFSIFNISISDL